MPLEFYLFSQRLRSNCKKSHFITQLMDIYTSTCMEWGLSLRSCNDSEILAPLPFYHDNVVFYSYLMNV